ncbi:GspH/FimT family pseudopilin [Rheinheimera sp. UJ63]|uniref:GspH/FimT family pseudopilin n=1 Tax=Rheinheimera sp. UJ63 TaxID=2910157 RepID=UPI001F407885|nr:GspH/FimT family pseudopilin [Rheinheimera sp. UJ63]MCF4010209.1 GspH/FimT family pseudopilin [Rheinheimera sp. UJ63]
MTSRSFLSLRKAAGLTLVELMVTVAVLAIVVSIAIPSFNGIVASNQLTGPANEVFSMMHFARSEAIRLNQNIEFCKSNADGTACNTSNGKWPGVLVMRPNTSGTPTLLRQLMFDTTFNVNSTHPLLVFNSQGFIRSSANAAISGTLRVCSSSSSLKDNSRDLAFVSGGRVSISKNNVTGCTAPSQ